MHWTEPHVGPSDAVSQTSWRFDDVHKVYDQAMESYILATII